MESTHSTYFHLRSEGSEIREGSENETRYITSYYGNTLPKILYSTFRDVNIRMGFQTSNNVGKILRQNPPKAVEDRTGVYKVVCLSLIHI